MDRRAGNLGQAAARYEIGADPRLAPGITAFEGHALVDAEFSEAGVLVLHCSRERKGAHSAKGKLYKTFDVAPCGKDFCGISVSDKGSCGETLFWFLTIHENNDEITGLGRWGDVKKKLTVGIAKPDGLPSYMLLGLGNDDLDITGREGSTPSFYANYKRQGDAVCKTS